MAALEETIRIGREAHDSGRDLASEGGRVKNLGRMPEIVARIERARAGRRRHRRGHLRLSRLVQRSFGVHSALGARRRQCQAHRAAQGPGNAGAYRKRARHAYRPIGTTNGSRVAGPGGHAAYRNRQNAELLRPPGPDPRRHRQGARHATRWIHCSTSWSRTMAQTYVAVFAHERARYCARRRAALGLVLQ